MKQIKIENNGVEQLITVPENSKVTIDGNVVVFEPKFKKGDVIVSRFKSNGLSCIATMIFNFVKGDELHYFYSTFSHYNSLFHNFVNISNATFEKADEEIASLMFDELKFEGKQWNAEKLCIEDLKVVPKVGDCVKLYFKDKYIAYFVCKENGKFTPKKSFLCNVLENGYTVTKTNLELDYNGNCEYDIQEEQQFQSELAQLGFEYDFENDTISELRWEPKIGELFYYFDDELDLCSDAYNTLGYSLTVKCGNYFKTSELCQQAIDKIKQVLNEK